MLRKCVNSLLFSLPWLEVLACAVALCLLNSRRWLWFGVVSFCIVLCRMASKVFFITLFSLTTPLHMLKPQQTKPLNCGIFEWNAPFCLAKTEMFNWLLCLRWRESVADAFLILWGIIIWSKMKRESMWMKIPLKLYWVRGSKWLLPLEIAFSASFIT